jgi:hypothetical protein
MADYQYTPVAVSMSFTKERRESSYNRRIITKKSISVQFYKAIGKGFYVIQRIRAMWVSGDLDSLPPCQILINRRTKLLYPFLEFRDTGR